MGVVLGPTVLRFRAVVNPQGRLTARQQTRSALIRHLTPILHGDMTRAKASCGPGGTTACPIFVERGTGGKQDPG